jgi:hypothetical protein
MSWVQLLGYTGVGLAIATNMMKTMIPLRALAMVCNVIFIAYGYLSGVYPSMVLQAVLLPINGYRLWEMVHLTRRVETASRGDASMDWLKPFMSRRRYRAGEVLFSKGAEADEMFYTVSGRFRLPELDIDVPRGEVFGELGLLAPEQRRTQTVACAEDGEVLVISYAQVKQLYYQNPQFGFFFLSLASGRLFANLERVETRLAECNAAAEIGSPGLAAEA